VYVPPVIDRLFTVTVEEPKAPLWTLAVVDGQGPLMLSD